MLQTKSCVLIRQFGQRCRERIQPGRHAVARNIRADHLIGASVKRSSTTCRNGNSISSECSLSRRTLFKVTPLTQFIEKVAIYRHLP